MVMIAVAAAMAVTAVEAAVEAAAVVAGVMAKIVPAGVHPATITSGRGIRCLSGLGGDESFKNCDCIVCKYLRISGPYPRISPENGCRESRCSRLRALAYISLGKQLLSA
jgi:hypothetical protein